MESTHFMRKKDGATGQDLKKYIEQLRPKHLEVKITAGKMKCHCPLGFFFGGDLSTPRGTLSLEFARQKIFGTPSTGG